MSQRAFLAVAALVVVAGFLVSRVLTNQYYYFAAYVILQYVVLATAWNILGGYTGYVNFGTPAFFALGAYTSVVLIKMMNAPLGLQLGAVTPEEIAVSVLAEMIAVRRGVAPADVKSLKMELPGRFKALR